MKDRIIVITGASSGLGATLAEQLGARGARIVLAARRKAELDAVAALCGADALAVVADVTERADVARIRDAALGRFGHIDAWINNVGRSSSRTVEAITDEDLDDMILINVKSALYGMQAILPHFKERGRGHIINVSSMLGRVPYVSIRSAYSASKAALNSLTANLRMDLAGRFPDIAVSLVMPGRMNTGFAQSSVSLGAPPSSSSAVQSADEVAAAIVGLLEQPRAEIFTMPGHAELAARYHADVEAGEALVLAEAEPSARHGAAL